ncbi:hypothetical protein HHI36_018296 [Cryptolaemus montrouzieri]|uniref:HTH psq-type domain-containing protein n=1 Tax=Cryptolaemus montrouzieri TaxID=559131 RepID=A0ABD2NZJ2_9CUCU
MKDININYLPSLGVTLDSTGEFRQILLVNVYIQYAVKVHRNWNSKHILVSNFLAVSECVQKWQRYSCRARETRTQWLGCKKKIGDYFMNYNSSTLRKALQSVKRKQKTLREAAEYYEAPTSSLHDRLKKLRLKSMVVSLQFQLQKKKCWLTGL